MSMQYTIMRKDDPITTAEFSEDGTMVRYDKEMAAPALAPLQSKAAANWLQQWWRDRSIPISQGKVAVMLKERGLLGPEDYLIRNLGLSLTDYYWIKPVHSGLTWQDVNLYRNPFRDDLFLRDPEQNKDASALTPNSSLQGQLEKTWMIDGNGNRILIKGNRDHLSSESINEVIASELHRLQGFHHFVPYHLIHIKGRDYDYGCFSRQFTSEKLELVSAYAVVTSCPQRNDVSSYEHFIKVCGSHGIDEAALRADMEYQIMTDFILSNRDRHLSNISILRDADTLQFLRMAPIYDSGKSLFVNAGIPVSEKELLRIQTNSFASSELKLLSYVKDRSLVDVSRLPGPEYIKEMYQMDSQMEEKRIDLICKGYEMKIDKFRDFQLGHDLHRIVVPVSMRRQNNIPELDSICGNMEEQEGKTEIAKEYTRGEITVIHYTEKIPDGVLKHGKEKQTLLFSGNDKAVFIGEKDICDRLMTEYDGISQYTNDHWVWSCESNVNHDEVENLVSYLAQELEH